jgi:hypothetical protein
MGVARIHLWVGVHPNDALLGAMFHGEKLQAESIHLLLAGQR